MYKWVVYINGGQFPYKLLKQNIEYNKKEFLTYEKTPDIDPHVRYEYQSFYSYMYYIDQKIKKKYIEHYDTNKLERPQKPSVWKLINDFSRYSVKEHNLYVEDAKEIGIYLLRYNSPTYMFIKDAALMFNNDIGEKKAKTEAEILYESMDGYAFNNLILLLDVSDYMNSNDKMLLFKKSFKPLLNILRKEDKVSIVVYSGKAKLVLYPTSCEEKYKILEVLDTKKSEGSNNIDNGLKLAYFTALNDFIPGGNNRIIIVTNGQLSINKSIYKQAKVHSKKDIHLSIFQFGNNQSNNKLLKLSASGNGNYELIDKNNAALKLIKEVKPDEMKKID